METLKFDVAESDAESKDSGDGKSFAMPEEYFCQMCHASDTKLWRLPMSETRNFWCAKCAAEEYKIDISGMDEKGLYRDKKSTQPNRLTDKIGGCVPAIPAFDYIGYWNPYHAPSKDRDWWEKLPNSQIKET